MGKTRLDRFFTPIHRHLPRIIAGVWCLWSWSMVAAYVGGAPRQLAKLEASVPFQLWFLWLIAAVLLTVGTALPRKGKYRRAALPRKGKYRRAARCARVCGLAMVTILIMLWAAAFFTADMARGWVSAKNYLLILFFSVFTSYFIARDRPSPTQQLIEGRPIE